MLVTIELPNMVVESWHERAGYRRRLRSLSLAAAGAGDPGPVGAGLFGHLPVPADRQVRVVRRCDAEPLGQRDRVERRAHLDVVVEVDERRPGAARGAGGASTVPSVGVPPAAQVRIRAAHRSSAGGS